MKLYSCPLAGRAGHQAGLDLLERAYQTEFGLPLPPILRTERGKPYFENTPCHFSISHTSRHAFCVLAEQNVAVDAEELDRQVSPKLAQRILSPEELAQYRASPEPNQALLRFWVLKEAAAKLSGLGLTGFPNHTSFRLDDPRLLLRDGCIVAVLVQDDDQAPSESPLPSR